MPRKRAAPPREAFLSHSSKNATFANRLVEVLRAHGVRAFFSPRHILGAQQWHDEIGAALKRCDWFLLVLSPQSVASEWVKKELVYALQKNPYRNRIVPILYKKCEADQLSWTLSGFQWVDFQRDFHEGCRDLLRIWGVEYVRGRTASARRRRGE